MKELNQENDYQSACYDKFTLRFKDEKIQEAFKQANVQSFIQNGRVALIVSIFIYLIFGITDFFIIPDIFFQAIILRLSIGAVLGIGSFILSYFDLFNEYGDKIIGFTVLMAGMSILYMLINSSSDLKNYYFFGFYIVVLVSNVFFRQSFLNCLLWSIFFSLGFEYTVFHVFGYSYLNLLNHWYFYSALIMLLVNSYNSEKHRINDFLLRREISWHNDNLKQNNTILDEAVNQKTHELQMAYQREKKANSLQHTFLMNISHQVRTPLNTIIGVSDQNYLVDDIASIKKEILQINESGKELLRIVDDIALYSKIEAGSLKIINSDFNLNSLFLKVVSFFNEINKKQISLKITPVLQNEYVICSDFDKLLTILQSLVYGAYIRSSNEDILINYKIKNENKITFTVEDKGKTISNNFVSDILSGTWIEKNKMVYTAGFGLALTHELSSFFGRGFEISNKEDYTSISFEVNARISIGEKKHPAPRENKNLNLTGIKILVVEDIKINFSIIKKILVKRGAEVDWAQDGLIALEKISQVKDYDLILMDIQMPNMNGIEATQKIRSLGIKTPVIAQTANILADDKDICLRAGCDSYLGKPINAQELLDNIAQYVFE